MGLRRRRPRRENRTVCKASSDLHRRRRCLFWNRCFLHMAARLRERSIQLSRLRKGQRAEGISEGRDDEEVDALCRSSMRLAGAGL